MIAEELTDEDVGDVVALWEKVGLTRPWNDPVADFRRALIGSTSSVLGISADGQLVGTVMVGHDGHRGWVYYLAVREDHRRQGLGATLMDAAEEWLRRSGAVKSQLMVRRENEGALRFYQRVGYEASDVTVLARWL